MLLYQQQMLIKDLSNINNVTSLRNSSAANNIVNCLVKRLDLFLLKATVDINGDSSIIRCHL